MLRLFFFDAHPLFSSPLPRILRSSAAQGAELLDPGRVSRIFTRSDVGNPWGPGAVADTWAVAVRASGPEAGRLAGSSEQGNCGPDAGTSAPDGGASAAEQDSSHLGDHGDGSPRLVESGREANQAPGSSEARSTCDLGGARGPPPCEAPATGAVPGVSESCASANASTPASVPIRVPAEVSLRLVRVPASLSVPHMQRRGPEPSFQVEMTWATAEPARVRFEVRAHLLTEQELETITSWEVHDGPTPSGEDAGAAAMPDARRGPHDEAGADRARARFLGAAVSKGRKPGAAAGDAPDDSPAVESISASFSTLLAKTNAGKGAGASAGAHGRRQLRKRSGEDATLRSSPDAPAAAAAPASGASGHETPAGPHDAAAGAAAQAPSARSGGLLGDVASAPDLETVLARGADVVAGGTVAVSAGQPFAGLAMANMPSPATPATPLASEAMALDDRSSERAQTVSGTSPSPQAVPDGAHPSPSPQSALEGGRLSPSPQIAPGARRYGASTRLTFNRLRFAASSAMRPRWVAFTAWAPGKGARLDDPPAPLVLLLVTLPTVVMSRAAGQIEKATKLLWGPFGVQEVAARRHLTARAPGLPKLATDGEGATPVRPLVTAPGAASADASTPLAQSCGVTTGSATVNHLQRAYATPGSQMPFAGEPGGFKGEPLQGSSSASWGAVSEGTGAKQGDHAH